MGKGGRAALLNIRDVYIKVTIKVSTSVERLNQTDQDRKLVLPRCNKPRRRKSVHKSSCPLLSEIIKQILDDM